jgi:carboxylesterase
MFFLKNRGKKQENEKAGSSYRVKEKARPYYLKKGGSDTVAVLIHGFTGSPHDMRELADFLYAKGMSVLAVRIAGHGTSIEDLMNTSYNDWVNGIEKEVDGIISSYKRVFLIGYSFGANLALDLAARKAGRYKGVVCLGTSIFWKHRPYYFTLYHIFKVLGIKKVRKPYVPRDKVEQFELTGNYADFPTAGLGMFRDVINKVTIKTAKNVNTPALIIHSRGDRISHPKSSEYLFEAISSQYKEMFILSEFGHNPLRSENRDKIFSKVIKFIEG